MDKINRDQIELLIELQKKELVAAKIKLELDTFPEKTGALSAGLQEFEKAILNQKEILADLKKDYKSNDADILTNQERIKKREGQLRAIKTNKEYQAILKEIDEIKKTNSRIEDETIEFLDKIDSAETEVKEKEDLYEVEEESINQQISELEAEAKTEKRSLDTLMAERNEIAQKIEPELIKQYDFIKSQARNIAIVEVKNSICLGCNMNIPPQMYNELHKGNVLRSCPHCHRMLYVL